MKSSTSEPGLKGASLNPKEICTVEIMVRLRFLHRTAIHFTDMFYWKKVENPQNFGYQIVFRPVEVHHFSGSRLQQHLTVFFSYFPEKSNPYFEILGPRILFQIYPFLSEIMDERGVIFSLTLHPPGKTLA